MRMRIDPHVHCRDGEQSYKETIWHVFQIAERQGVGIIFDMPNTDPPIIYSESVSERTRMVPSIYKGRYFLWVGLTSDVDQVKHFVRISYGYPIVVGAKLYAGESTGSLGVIGLDDQRKIYQTLADEGYRGALAVHCEREDLLRRDLWDVHNPISHSRARPKEAEYEAVKDQINFARRVGFEGTLHIVHVSCRESVELVSEARRSGLKITCGVTPHHLMFVDEAQNQGNGTVYKVNPPLRSLDDVKMLQTKLLAGQIDWIETDHAPHAIGEKIFSSNPPSGIPSMYLYKELVEDFLPGIGASNNLIEAMTFGNIVRVFGAKLARMEAENDIIV